MTHFHTFLTTWKFKFNFRMLKLPDVLVLALLCISRQSPICIHLFGPCTSANIHHCHFLGPGENTPPACSHLLRQIQRKSLCISWKESQMTWIRNSWVLGNHWSFMGSWLWLFRMSCRKTLLKETTVGCLKPRTFVFRVQGWESTRRTSLSLESLEKADTYKQWILYNECSGLAMYITLGWKGWFIIGSVRRTVMCANPWEMKHLPGKWICEYRW